MRISNPWKHQTSTNAALAFKRHNRPLASWLYNQRKRFHKGALEPISAKLLSQLDESWHQFSRDKPEQDDESMQTAPPTDLSHAAQCLIKMSRVSSGDLSLDEDEKDEDYVDQGEVRQKSKLQRSSSIPTVDFAAINLAFCEGCNKKKRDHHHLCPKSATFKREKLEKIVQGASVGCFICSKEFEFGCHKGRNDKHSTQCSRSKHFMNTKTQAKDIKPSRTSKAKLLCRPVSPSTVVDITTESTGSEVDQNFLSIAKRAPKKRPFSVTLLPPLAEISVTVPPNIVFRPHEISPLITVDTYDMDALIIDLEDGVVDGKEALARLQKIRRMAL